MRIENQNYSWTPIPTCSSGGSAPLSDADAIALAYRTYNQNLAAVQNSRQTDSTGQTEVTIRVPADADGNPINFPTEQEWEFAAKNNRFVETTGKPEELERLFLGNEVRGPNALNDIDPSTLNEAFQVFGQSYNDAMSRAQDESKKMENLRKKYTALEALENSISGPNTSGETNTSGANSVTISVPTKRYVTDADGNRVKGADGNYLTEDITNPPSNEDWANAVPDSFTEVTDEGHVIAKEYFGIEFTRLTSEGAHETNLSNNLGKIANHRALVDAEMKQISGKFDYWMGNVQTNLSMLNKLLSQVNDTILQIARGL